MSSRKKGEARALVDNRQLVPHPLDFSFKAIQEFPGRPLTPSLLISMIDCADLLRERPRLRDKQLQGVFDLEDELSTGSSGGSLEVEKFPSTALKVNNNILLSWDGFMTSIAKLFQDPVSKLGWIDFSFNDLKTIDVVCSRLI